MPGRRSQRKHAKRQRDRAEFMIMELYELAGQARTLLNRSDRVLSPGAIEDLKRTREIVAHLLENDATRREFSLDD